MPKISIYLDQKTYDLLQELTDGRRITASAIVRAGIRMYAKVKRVRDEGYILVPVKVMAMDNGQNNSQKKLSADTGERGT
jgi:hypothetical protein